MEGWKFGTVVTFRHSMHRRYFRRIPNNRATSIDRPVR